MRRTRRSSEGAFSFVRLLPLVGLIASAGCASAHATGKPADRPALNVPPPPLRVIEPADVPPEPVAELPVSSSAPAPRPPRPAASRSTPSDNKADAKPGEEKVDLPPVDPPPAPTSAAPAAQLRTPQTADTSGAARSIRAAIDTARGILNRVDYGPLSNELKKAYNDAKVFLQQAEDALKEGNFAFAQGVVKKADTLAKELAIR